MDRSLPEKQTKRLVIALKERRIKMGLSQNQLAAQANLSRAAISHLESGNRLPTLLTCFTLAQCLGIPLSDLIKEVEESDI